MMMMMMMMMMIFGITGMTLPRLTVCFTRHLFNSNNFAASAAMDGVCAHSGCYAPAHNRR